MIVMQNSIIIFLFIRNIVGVVWHGQTKDFVSKICDVMSLTQTNDPAILYFLRFLQKNDFFMMTFDYCVTSYRWEYWL